MAPKVLIVGDSVFDGKGQPNISFYFDKVAEGKYDVVNRAVAGSNLVEIGDRIAQDILDTAPDYVVLQGGVNDIAENVNTQDIIGRYQDLIDATLTAGISEDNIIVTTIAPWYSQDGEQDYQTTRDVNHWIVMIDTEFMLLDASNILSDAYGDNLAPEFSYDGIHINGFGAKELAIQLYDILDSPNIYPRCDHVGTRDFHDYFNRDLLWLGDGWSDIRGSIRPTGTSAVSRWASDISSSVVSRPFRCSTYASCRIKPNAVSSFGSIVFTNGNWRDVNQFSFSGNGNKFEVTEMLGNRIRRQIDKIYDIRHEEILVSVEKTGNVYRYFIDGQKVGECYIPTDEYFYVGMVAARKCEIRDFTVY